MRINLRILFITCLLVISLPSCSSEPMQRWMARNSELIQKYQIVGRQRTLPALDVGSNLKFGQPIPSAQLPVIQIAPGVSAKLGWAEGVLVELVEMGPGTVYPKETVVGESITFVEEGSAECFVNESTLTLSKDAVLYLTEGTKRFLKAGREGWTAIEVFSPVRVDHLRLAGMTLPKGAKISIPDQGVSPSLQPGRIYNLNDIQFTPLTPPDSSLPYPRSSANSRLIWGKNFQLSFIRMDPNSTFPLHFHPEVQLMITLRGILEQRIMDRSYRADGQSRHTFHTPGGMVHSAKIGGFGADALDVFWPVRPDYVSHASRQSNLYREVIPPDAKPVKIADGFTFCEGATWLNGRLYFSDMFFRDPAKGDWTRNPARSRLIQMEAKGHWKVLSQGMQTNGTIALGSRRLLVCDMFGHRVIELDAESGRVVKTLLDSVNGIPIDGPNDLIMDAKGGIYITDPQFTPEAQKSQPGTQVYYVTPNGTARVVIPAGQYAMPNGVEISPDGKTLYVDNTWSRPGENFVWAYDIQENGSLSNKRKFAALNLLPDVLSASDPAKRFDSMADGMTVDVDGRLYVTTRTGLQIFDKTGLYVGTVWLPEPQST